MPTGAFFDPSRSDHPAWLQHLAWGLGQTEVILTGAGLALVALLLMARRWRLELAPDFATRLFLALACVLAAVVLPPTIGLLSRRIDPALHDTYYIVADACHGLGLVLAALVFAAIYRGFRSLTGAGYRRGLAGLHGALFAIGSALLAAAPLVVAEAGMPARYTDGDDTGLQMGMRLGIRIAGAGYIVTMLSFAVFAICLVEAITRRNRTGRDPD